METAVSSDAYFNSRFEQFMAGMAEIRKIQEEAAQRSREYDERWEKQKIEDEKRKIEDEIKWEKQKKEYDRICGKLGNRFGELIEHLVAPNLLDKFNELGFHFDRGSNTNKIKDHATRTTLTEIDVVLENDDAVIAVEVKAKPNENDIKEHIERMEILRKFADRKQDRRKYYGAIAGAIMGDAIRRNIIQTGFYLIEQTGDTVQVTVPEGFTPHAW